ncbi:MAG: hypothetical protein EBU84_21230, partial [Actinobacteria bacterium]|nr:hypothetical protein [Actinomycetota bacterium]
GYFQQTPHWLRTRLDLGDLLHQLILEVPLGRWLRQLQLAQLHPLDLVDQPTIRLKAKYHWLWDRI